LVVVVVPPLRRDLSVAARSPARPLALVPLSRRSLVAQLLVTDVGARLTATQALDCAPRGRRGRKGGGYII
jgi:hypothetical protein